MVDCFAIRRPFDKSMLLQQPLYRWILYVEKELIGAASRLRDGACAVAIMYDGAHASRRDRREGIQLLRHWCCYWRQKSVNALVRSHTRKHSESESMRESTTGSKTPHGSADGP